ncbi:cytochrome P450 [Metabacillus sp. KIGAM252]|uniref:Bifunctional cytochrome P450/NADPH--P450 reductase n=1 Tax=Metabacillus flavus TaxID=2823519 RepID=A0ABS5LFJ9_9BACI|nr:cytochrome P450 [Metabacillus flavus]MBS2969526.1 cytochrome P450 [Metabacillus flavus]
MTSQNHIPKLELKSANQAQPLLNPECLIQSLMKISERAGPIFQFDRPPNGPVFLSSHKLVSEVFDESRFDKSVSRALQNLRPLSGDGLFTSWTHEPNWKKAHNILLPCFSQKAMKGYHSMMIDVAVQLLQKWERLNSGDSIDVSEDMTRLTLDTIGLCGFNYRFNSFYREQFHPFLQSMGAALSESMSKLMRSKKDAARFAEKEAAFQDHIQIMFDLVDQVIEERKQLPEEEWAEDLLSSMLRNKDPETGELLDDENIRFQIITFLIAGHETTSGLLTFAFYQLLKNKRVLQKAQEEADRVLTSSVPTYKEVKKLKYVQMILNETLRLWPTAPAISLYAKKTEVIGGEFALEKGQEVTVLLPQLHRDKSVWGEDAEEFKPERFEDMSTLPPHAFKPFGNGQRACIGQQFALHEATLILGLLLKHFDFVDHTNYQLDIKETLSWKPNGFTMKVKSRKKWIAAEMEKPSEESPVSAALSAPSEDAHRTPLLILYGSNMGTSEGLAKQLAKKAFGLGFQAEIGSLDDFVCRLPKQGAVVIFSSSYNGSPPDNAGNFIRWVDEAEEAEMNGMAYGVFGCGDRSWSATYQRIPVFIDQKMEEKGALRIARLGKGDADADFHGEYKEWERELWASLAVHFNIELQFESMEEADKLTIEFVSGEIKTPIAEVYQAFSAKIAVNKELQAPESSRSTRHIEITLPEGVTYREGGHIGILPHNSPESVNRVLRRFRLSGRETVVLKGEGTSASHLPMGQPIEVRKLLSACVELQHPVTRNQLKNLAEATVCPPHKFELEAMLNRYQEDILAKRISILELLEKYMACELTFERFIGMLPALKPRYYSISSSPEKFTGRVSLTVSVLKGPAWSGAGEYKGVSSGYLARLLPGDEVKCFIREPQNGFERPANPETPIIMVGTGSGVAPFRGFLQGRRALQDQGCKLGEAHLYFGCRNSKLDFLYEQELKEAEKDGLVFLHTAFSREESSAQTYVQHLIKEHASELLSLLEKNAHLYICGDGSKMAPDVEGALKESYQAVKNASEEEAAAWLADLQQQGRFAKDVWAGK